MPSPTLQGYRRAGYLRGRWPLSTAYSCFHSGPSLSAPLTFPGILAGPQLTCSGSLSLRTWLHAALKCLSWSFGVMVLNMKTLRFSEKLCVLYAVIGALWNEDLPVAHSLPHLLQGFSQILCPWWALAWSPLSLYLSTPGLAYLLFLPIRTVPSVVLHNVLSCLFIYLSFGLFPADQKFLEGVLFCFNVFVHC